MVANSNLPRQLRRVAMVGGLSVFSNLPGGDLTIDHRGAEPVMTIRFADGSTLRFPGNERNIRTEGGRIEVRKHRWYHRRTIQLGSSGSGQSVKLGRVRAKGSKSVRIQQHRE
jgi:hypothetical protein